MSCRLGPSSGRRIARALVVVALAGVGVTLSAQQPQVVPGTNVNMVSGTTFPDGDPYLQRQNEPSSAVSTRNPLHILSGVNDYRTVDIPGPFDPLRGFKMNADAWVGLFKSVDGGQNWKSTLLPGFPQDVSADGLGSPIKGRQAATDPVMRSGTDGIFYYAGVAFDRGDNKPSAIFMARFMDLNNIEAGDPFGYVDTRIVDADGGTRFLDKPAVATDIPRGTATCTISSRQINGTSTVQHVQTIPSGNIYVAYSAFTGHGAEEQSVILFSRSTNCGQTWSAPKALSTGSRLVQNAQIAVSPVDGAVYVTWRRFKYLTQDDAVMMVKSIDGGVTFGKVLRVSGVRPFDQGTTPTSFRSNGFQTMAIDATGRVYLAWPDRGYAEVRSDPVIGDSRIVISTSANGSTWTVPRVVQATGIGHQLMPALSFHGGKLRLLYYDLREDVSQLFGQFIDELPILNGPAPRIRHTIDAFVAQALPGAAPVFTTSRISDYARGFMPGSTIEERLQFNPPNLPLFRQGAVPFMGDYIDIAPAPPFVLNDAGAWVFNTAASGSVVSHAFWTDNRDVRAPADGNWANYTPVTSDAVGTQSRFDATQMVPPCVAGQVGMRNQNVYTARVTDGLFVSAPGASKPFNGFQRAFVVVAENATSVIRTYRLRIENQPIGGQASFLQFGPALTTLDVTTPVLSSVARTVFVTSQDEDARIRVSLTEVTAPGGGIVPNGLTGTVVLNPDPNNPSLQNPSLQNPSLQNIALAEQYNPGITSAVVGVPSLQNPSLQNPSLQNPSLQNPSIQNPSLQNPSLQNPTLQNDAVANPSIVNAGVSNPSLQNPSLQNPSLQNPSLQNVDLTNAGFSDTNWQITNEGNTTASYTVNLLLNQPPPAGFTTQLLLHKTSKTPAADGCTLKEQLNTIVLANIPNPQFYTDPTNPSLQNPSLQNPSLQNPTLALAPGESATITFRVVDPNIFDGVTYDASAAVTPAAVAQSINTVDAGNPNATPPVAMPLTITTSTIPPTTPGAPISRTLQSVASTGPLVCSVISGQLPPGVTLSPTGTISGTPTTAGNYVFTVRCTDAGGKADEQTLSIQVDPAAPVSFDSLWNGADTNWYNPANWSPRGVPTAASRVYISAATTMMPKLTSNITIRDLFLEPGATLDANGFAATVTNNADAGQAIVGAGRTILTGNGGTAAGVFSNLEIQGRIALTAPLTTTGSLTLGAGARLELNGQPLIVGGQLITAVTEGALPIIIGNANSPFLAGGVNVNGLVVNGAPLTINGGALTRFDNVSFSGLAPDVVQLTVNNPGLVTHFPMNGLSFSTLPTTGLLLQASDTLDAGPVLILDVLGAVPADGSAFTATSGGAIVNWIPNPGEANLAVTQSVTPVPSGAGTRLNYTIAITNGGPVAATGVLLIPGVPLGAAAVLTSATQGSCVSTTDGYQCQLGNLPGGSAAVVTVSFIPATTGTLFTTASVSSDTPDSVIANNSHTIAATVLPAGQGVNLTLTKADSLDPVSLNTPFTYTLTATNNGTTVATNVLVTDNVPAGLAINFATSASGMCSAISSQVLCSFASLVPGESVAMTVNVTATATGIVTNRAAVTSAEVELTPADNLATQTTVVVATAVCSAVTFSGPVLFAANGPTGDVLVGDLNGDGFKDVVAPVPSANSVAVLLGNGTGNFSVPSSFSSGVGTHEGVILDFNNDGRLDIALEGLVDAFVLFGTGNGGFGPPVTLSFAPGIVGDVRAGDFNGDGRPDLAIPVGGPPNTLHILLNNGNGGFTDTTPIPLPGGADRVVVQDLNGDGRVDLALSYGGTNFPLNQVTILIGDGAGGFTAAEPVTLPPNSGTRVFGLGDINGDNRPDLGVVEMLTGSRRVHLLFGNGAGGFTSQLLTDQVPGAFRLIPGDVNGDGKRDLALSSGGIVYISLGDGTGGFGALSGFSTPFGLQFDLADVNADGRLDILSALNQGNGVAILLNGCNQPAGDLMVTASDSPDPVAEGATLTYSATVTNVAATAATGVTLTQSLSSLGAAGTATSSQGACTISGRLVSCTLGTLAPNASADVQVTFVPSAAATLNSQVGVGSAQPDSNPANNLVTLTTAATAAGRQIVVTNTNNGGVGSLRQAILDSNADTGDRDTIVFNIPGAGVRTITLLSALPQISQPVVIDGATQPGYAGGPLIELNGNGVTGTGLLITGGNSIVRGLAITHFNGAGVTIQTNGGNRLEANYIGIDPTGTGAGPNAGHGIQIESAANTIGGIEPAHRNVISGNGQSGVSISGAAATGNLIANNLIGTNGSGMSAIGNTVQGVSISNASGNTVGTPDAGNVISGNGQNGIAILGDTSAANQIFANRIGTNFFSDSPIANLQDGIRIDGAASTVIGGVGLARNIIGGNGQNGIGVYGSTGTGGTPAVGTQIVGNTIGFRSPPNTVGNGLSGIYLFFANSTVIGGATQDGTNLISSNGRNGVTIFFGRGNRIDGNNSIADNSGLGIDLGNDGVSANDAGDADIGPNDRQNFPVLAGVTGGVQGTLNSVANSPYTIQFFENTECDASGSGEGRTFLGAVNVTTDGNGNAMLPLFAAAVGQIITATATTDVGDTSEFSVCATVPAGALQADLSLTMTESADPVTLGTPYSYSLVLHNDGPAGATSVQVTDTAEAGISIGSAVPTQGTCTVQNQTVTCALGTIAADGSATITLNVTALTTGFVHNTAFVSTAVTDPVQENNTASAETTVTLVSCSVPTFTGPRPYAGSPGAMAVVRLVDMNHDGRLDAVATHERVSDGVDVFINDGTGQFAAPRFTSTVTGPWMHVVADFNGDTHPDVISATDRTAPGNPVTLRLLTNDGTGTLTLVPSFSIPFGGSLFALDMDRDGDQDLVIETTAGNLALLRNDGQANFGAPETILAGPFVFPMFGDFNGDNRTDVVVTLGPAGIAVVLANATGGFLPPVVQAVAGGAHAGADSVDLNGDGRLDLLIIAGDDNEPSQGASVMFGNGAGGFETAVPAIDEFVYFPSLADVNGDGRPDVVAISSLGSIAVWRGNGGSSFSEPVHFPNAVYYGPAVGDLNGDGRPDIATGDINGTLNVFLNNCGAAPASLSVAVAESADPISEGGELVYTVTVSNLTATAATGVRLTSVLSQLIDDNPELPAVTVLDATSSAGGTLTTTGATYAWTVPTLAANSTATFSFRFRALAGGTLQFATGVSSDGAETDPSDNSALESTLVTPTSRTLVVTTAADTGPGSLRQAIYESNADSGDRDTITFNIPGAVVPTITLLSELEIRSPVVIDGTTQPTAARVELNGNSQPIVGLIITGGNSVVRGLAINRFGSGALGLFTNGGNVIEGNFIGTDPTGTIARPNSNFAIAIDSAGNRIGGLTPAARNVISGNQTTAIFIGGPSATGNVVQGNYIGIDATGAGPLPNTSNVGGIQLVNGASGNTIGGAVAGAGNVVSGNTTHAISVFGSTTNDNVIQGNFIGTGPGGTTRIANGGIGVDVVTALRTIVGGPGLARNVISGNGTGIQIRTGAAGTKVQGNYIGLNAAGASPIFNSLGININSNAGVNTIGGTGAGEGNVISGNNGGGILIQTGSNGTILQGNLIGLDAGGTLDLGNTGDGLNLNGVTGTVIGGPAAGARNVISGNNNVGIRIQGAAATGNLVQGNYIGVNAAGGAAVGNTSGGITIQTGATGNTIGGTAAGEGNVISGNVGTGVTVQSSANGNTIQGNLIGLNAAGTQALGNLDGIRVTNVSGTIIGGTTAGARNLISGNSTGIQLLTGATATLIQGNRIGTNPAGTSAIPNGAGINVDGAHGNTIGTAVAGGGNQISGNTGNGIWINAADNNVVRNNLIGVGSNLVGGLANGFGVFVMGANNTIGGTGPFAFNTISGNTNIGISVASGATGTQIIGNLIGMAPSGIDPLPNGGAGVFLDGSGTTVGGPGAPAGADNVIANNGGPGIRVNSGTGHALLRNAIFNNGGLGIDLGIAGVTANDPGDADTGANNQQNFPVLTAVAGGVQGTLGSTANATFAIQYFRNTACDSSGNGEGEFFLGEVSVTTNATGSATLPVFSVSGGIVTATARNISTNDTSEFSSCVTVAASADLSLTQTDSADPIAFGQSFNYVLTGHNAGPAAAPAVVIADTVPAGLSIGSATSSQGSCAVVNQAVTCTIGTLAVNASATVTITVRALTAEPVTNTASIASSVADPVAGNNSDSEQTTIQLASCSVPSFSAPVPVAVPTYDGIFADQADLNGDGVNDLVVSMLPGGLAVRLNNGSGGFGPAIGIGHPAPLTFDIAPRSFALGDLNGDGKIDIAVATGSAMEVLIGAGNGSFSTPVPYALGAPEPLSAQAADLDKDGDLDVVLDSLDDNSGFIQVFRNMGNGVFAPVQLVTMAAVQPAVPVIGDFNGDGFPDFAAGSWQHVLSIVLADGNGGYLPAIAFTPGPSPVVAGDVTGDGKTDLIVQGDGAEDFRIWIGDGTGHFTPGAYLGQGATAVGTRLVDINRDGLRDLVVSHPSLGTVAVQLGQAGGTFAAPIHYASPFQFNPATILDDGDDISGGPSVGDLNGDGQLDIAYADPSGFINVLFSTCGQPAADLSVTAQDAADPVAEGTAANYVVTVTNHGPATASGVTVNLAVGGVFEPGHPALAHFTAVTGATCTLTDQSVSCVLGNLTSGQSVNLQATVATASGTTITLTASAASNNADPAPGDNTDFETTVVSASGRNLVVTNTNESGPGSLEQAIIESNSDSGDRDTIVFNIPGAGVHTITVGDGLPVISQPVVIDGKTQPGAGATPLIELNGNSGPATGLLISGGNSIVRGLAINRFGGGGISLFTGGGNTLEGNFIGTNPAGTAAAPNSGFGILVQSANNRIDGTTAAGRNVISGNQGVAISFNGATATNNVLLGNYIGLNAAGSGPLANTAGLVLGGGAGGNTIGGSATGNVISGNGGNGIIINAGSNGNIVRGNTIGLNAAGTAAVANTLNGINLNGPSSTTIGGTTAGAGNIIAGNTGNGIIAGSGTTSTLIQGNRIGTNAGGTASLPNLGHGVSLSGTNTTVGGTAAGTANIIANNGMTGVRLNNGTGHAILGNSIFGNASLGIDLSIAGITPNDAGDTDGGPNNNQNFPVLSAAAGGVQGTLNSTADSTFTVQYFANTGCDSSGNGEGETFLGQVSVTTNGSGNATLPLFSASSGQIVTATATNTTTNDTSEFSACVTVALGQGTFTVTNTNDSGTGSLRQAILDANARVGTLDTIRFNIPGQGPFRIAPTSPLPTITEGVVIDGTTQPGYGGTPLIELNGSGAGTPSNGLQSNAGGNLIRGLVINQFDNGILLNGDVNIVEANFIGTNVAGTADLGNRADGVVLGGKDNLIGGNSPGQRNVISGNDRHGILLSGAGATGTVIVGNWIGVGVGGQALANTVDGINVNAAGNIIGGGANEGNLIFGNGRAGVYLDAAASGTGVYGNYLTNNLWGVQIVGPQNLVGGFESALGNTITSNVSGGVMVLSGTGNSILGNSISNNGGGLGIDLAPAGVTANDSGDGDTGANNLQNFPVLTAGQAGVDGTLNSSPNSTFRIEYFGSEACNSSGNGEGETYLGNATVTTDANGNAILPFFTTGSGLAVTATATSSGNNTSEFSACVEPEQVFRNWISNTGGNWEDPTKWSGGIVPQPGEDVFIDGNFTVAISSATVSLTSIFTTAHVQMSGGALTIGSSASFFGGLTMTGGTLDGRGVFFLDGVSSWTGGQMTGSGLTIVSETGTLTVSSTAPGVLNRSIGNQGRLVWNQPSLALQNTGIINQANATLEIQNLPITGGFLNNQGLLLKTGAPGALTLTGTTFTNSGQVRLRLGPTSDTIVSDGHVQLEGGSLELVLQPGFDPAEGAAFDVFEWANHSGTFQNVFGTGRLYDADYGNTVLTVTARHGLVTPLAFNGFSANAHIETFTPNFGRQAPPVTFNGLTYSSPGTQLISDTTWDGFYDSWPTASGGFGLNDLVGLTELQIDFSAPVRRVGLLAVTGSKSTLLLKAYDDNLTLIGITSTTMPDQSDAAFLGLESTVNIRRVVLTEPYDNTQITIVDDIQWEGPTNQRPIANAGPDQSVNASSSVQLNGSGSSDPENQTLTYQWQIVSKPPGSNVTLVNDATATPTLVPDVPGTYVIRLIVNDGSQNSNPDDVEIHVNGPPVADAGPDQTVPVGSTVQLDGIGSTDPESSTLSYHWILNSRPSSSAAVLSNADIRNPTFVADAPGTYIAQLVVNDGLVNSPSDLIVIRTQNRAPIANAGADKADVAINSTVTLDGSLSADPDGDPISYSWAFTLKPSGSSASLQNAGTAAPSFVVDRPGRYRIALTLNDGQATGTDTVDVTTVNVPPVANAGSDQTVHLAVQVTLNGSASTDANGNELSYAWQIVSAPAGSTAQLTGATTVSPTFTPDVTGVYTIRLVVNDTIVDSPADTMTVTVLSNAIVLSLVDTPLVGVGRQATVRVQLPFEAPPGGVTVNVTSSNTGIATVAPATVTIAAGQTLGQAAVTGVEVGTATLTATAPGYADGVLLVTVTRNVLSVPATLNVALGGTASFPVTLATAAPAGGLVVTLTSSDSAVVELVTPTVTIPAGSFGANGTVRGRAIGSATVTASRTDYSSASSLVTATAQLNILETSLTVRPSFPQPITVRLDSGGSAIAAPAPGVIVSLVPGNTSCVTTNAPVTIATGLISVQATVSYGGTATLPCTTTLRAEAPGVTPETINITVQPDPGITLFSLPASVGAGLQYGTFSGSLGEANHGGVTVRVTSSNPSVLLLSRTTTAAGTPFVDIPVADNQTSFSYVLHGVENVVADATVTASSASFQSATGTVHVVQPAIEIGGLTTSTTSLSPVAPFVARIGVPAGSPTNSFVSPVQVVRVGGQAVTVTVNNSNGNVAQLTNSAGAAQSQTVTIAAGQSQSPSSVATGGVAFDPISPGSTSVSVTATGVIPMTSATVGVTVTAPGIQLFSLPTVVGSGLQYGTFSGQLGGADHQGVDVRIASSNPNILKVSPNATTGGTDSISIHLNPGSISFSYYIHGMEGATGEATLTVSASGFTTATGTAQVVTPGIEIGGLPATTNSLAASDAFVARVGILAGSVNNTFVSPAQAVRVGGTPLTVTFTNSNGDAAQLVTATTTGQTATVTIAVGQTQSPGTVATGGVEFDPRGGGSTTVAGSAPGTVPTTAATRSVSVTAPAIQLFSLPASVGSGLQYGSFSGQLGGSQHGGVSVHIASSNPNVLRIAKDSSTAGTDAIDIRLENGDISFSYWIQGVEGATGPATITATAPGFTSAQGTANVLQPALHLVGLTTSLTSLAANDVFAAQIGVLNGTTITAQSLRPGAASVTVTITSSNAAVGQLTTSTGTAQTRTVSIVAGQSQSPGTVAAGGIEFDPTGGGTTTVSASIPGFLAAPDASVNVTVTAPGIQLFSLPATVGSGLQYGSFSGQLGGSQHNGLTVRVTSSNPSVLKVSATAAQEGRDFVDLPVAAGGISFSYWIHGMERVTGGVTLTVSAPGFTDATGTAFVVQPGIELAGLLASTTTLSVNDPFSVRTGVPAGSAPNTFISPAQEVRIGGENVVVTITNGTAAAGQLVTAAGADQSRTVTIMPGNSLSPGTVAAGGIEFDPLNPGQTTVVASAPGFAQTGAASSQVTVSAPGITLFSLPVSVGSGLMYGSMSGQLGASGHNGVTVRLTSSNPAVMRLSATSSELGAAFVDIRLNPGDVSFLYWIHGIEGAVADATITATAPGFVTEVGTVHIVQPGLDIQSLASSISATAANDAFVVRVGVPQLGGDGLALTQAVRSGSSLTVTVTTSNVNVGQLVTLAGGAGSRTITIPAGTSQSPATVAAGGIEFDPLTAGTATVNATIPGVVPTNLGTVVVVVGGAP